MQLYGSQTITGQLLLTDTGIALSAATLVVQGAAGQTGNLAEFRNSTGAVQSYLNPSGTFVSNGNGATIAALGTPVITGVTPTGGTGSTTYGYRVAAVNQLGTTIASTEVTTTTGVATLSGTQYNVITWNPIGGAANYRVYGRTAGGELFMAAVTAPTTTFTDDGTITPSGALPSAPVGGNLTVTQWNSQTGPIFRVQQYGGGTNFLSVSGTSGNTVANAGLIVAGTQGGGAMQAVAGLYNTTGTQKVLALQGASGQTADTFVLTDITNAVLARIGSAGAIQNYGAYAFIGGLGPPAIPTLATVGTPGSTTYAYRIVVVSQNGSVTVPGPEATIATGNATLDGTNYVTVTFNNVIGAVAFRVYGRTVGGELLLATVTADGRSGSYTYNDQGATPAGALPTVPTGSSFLTVQGWASQTAAIAQFLDGASNTLASVQANPATGVGVIQTWVASVGSGALKLGSQPGFPNTPTIDSRGYHNSIDGSGAALRIFNYNVSSTVPQAFLGGNTGFQVSPSNGTNIGEVIKAGAALQSADLTQWQDSSANILGRVNGLGQATLPALTVLGPVTSLGQLTAQQVITNPNTLATPAISGIVTAGTAGTTTYTYRVQAVNSFGVSVASAEVAIATGNSVLNGTNYNTISWAAVAGATSYRVYGRTAGAEAIIGITSSTSFNDNTVAGGQVPAGPGVNPIPASSANINLSGWVQTNCTQTRDLTTAPPFGGVTATLVTSAASGGTNVQTSTQQVNGYRQLVPVTASTVYTGSFWVMLGTFPGPVSVGLQWFDATGSYISGGAGITTGTVTVGAWTRVTFSLISSASAVFANVYLGFTATAAGQTLWVAAPQIDLGSFPTPYNLDIPLQTGGLYEGSARVYSPNNPPPGSTSNTSLQISSSAPVALAFASPWGNYGSGNSLGQYYRRADGWISVQGLVTNTATITAPSTIAQLPAPADGLYHTFTIWDLINSVPRRVDLTPTGQLNLQFGGGANGGFDLDGISYYVGGSTSTYVAGPAMAIPTDTVATITLVSPFVNYSPGIAAGYAQAKYMKTAGGQVYLQGVVNNNSGSPVTGGAQIASGLPVPADGLDHVFDKSNNGTVIASFRLSAAGNLYVQSGSITSGNNIFLDGIVYLTTSAGNAGFASSSFATSVKFGSER